MEASNPSPSSSSSNPTAITSSTSNMSSSNFSQVQELNHEKEPTYATQASVEGSSDPTAEDAAASEAEVGGEGEEEEGECGFCLYMKAGGCKEEFVKWQDCVEKAEKDEEDIVEKCSDITYALRICMQAHSDYYGALLQTEEEVARKVLEEEEKERQKNNSESEEKERKDETKQSEKEKASDGSGALEGSDREPEKVEESN